MGFLQFLRGDVSNVISGIGQQQQVTQQLLGTLRSYVPKVQQSWIGGDADEFAADFARKVVPAMVELIAAIGGINLNLNKATDIIDKADGNALKQVQGLADIFSKI
jgi:WXG100 family type VII secretion target